MQCLTGGGGEVWIDVPFVKQEKYGCGAASIAMLMQYWSRDADPRQIQKEIDSGEPAGARGSDVRRYLQQHGFRTFVFEGQWSDLTEHLAKGRPLLVCLNPTTHGPSHYVVVAGVDPVRNLVLINDPGRRKLLKVERAGFDKDWSAAHRWTLLAVPEPAK